MTAHEGVLIVDHNKMILYADRRTCEILGVTLQDLIGQHCSAARSFLPCAEEACQLSSDCRLYQLPEGESSGRENAAAHFESKALRGQDGQPVATVHIVTVPEKVPGEAPGESTTEFCGITGGSAVMCRMFELIELVAKTNVSVHISGESGTGKELVAEAIHKLSDRSGKRLVRVNCSTIPATLLESALFGHVKGAFTGAHKESQGFVEYADGGTLFLDEIGDVSLEVQVKLLRLLQSREYQRVGDAQTRRADLRIITATNQDLRELIKSGKMREDFYYRINVFPIAVPALRDRGEDLPLLAAHFVRMFNARFSKNILGTSHSALDLLQGYDWPGNVRELEHAIEHAFVKASNGYLQVEHLPEHALRSKSAASNVSLSEEEVRVVRALTETSGNVTRAAEILGYSRVTLWKRMKLFGISRNGVVERSGSIASTDSE